MTHVSKPAYILYMYSPQAKNYFYILKGCKNKIKTKWNIQQKLFIACKVWSIYYLVHYIKVLLTSHIKCVGGGGDLLDLYVGKISTF